MTLGIPEWWPGPGVGGGGDREWGGATRWMQGCGGMEKQKGK